MPPRRHPPAVLLLIALLSLSAFAAGSGVVGENLLWLAIILMARACSRRWRSASVSRRARRVAARRRAWQPRAARFHYFDRVAADPIVAFLAELGVIVLLLQIGLETRLDDLVKVGLRATLVGVVGIAVPFALGAYVVGPALLPGQSDNTYLFLGATLAATSVGITGRVFRDLGRLGMAEARIVLGAAVIDDVLGLVILAVVSSLVQAGSVSVGQVGMIVSRQ